MGECEGVECHRGNGRGMPQDGAGGRFRSRFRTFVAEAKASRPATLRKSRARMVVRRKQFDWLVPVRVGMAICVCQVWCRRPGFERN